MKALLLPFQFLPITAFVLVARAKGFTVEGWKAGFLVGEALAVLEMIVFLSLKLPIHRLLLGVNLYLVVGSMAFTFSLEPLLTLYGNLRESALFGMIAVIGVVSTLFSPKGFIEVAHPDRARVRRFSWMLVGVSIVSLTVSFLYRSNVWLAGTLPFVLLLVSRRFLQQRVFEDRRTRPE